MEGSWALLAEALSTKAVKAPGAPPPPKILALGQGATILPQSAPGWICPRQAGLAGSLCPFHALCCCCKGSIFAYWKLHWLNVSSNRHPILAGRPSLSGRLSETQGARCKPVARSKAPMLISGGCGARPNAVVSVCQHHCQL